MRQSPAPALTRRRRSTHARPNSPRAAAIVIFITALLLALKLLVIPAMERSDPAVQARALATIGALQTQEAVTRAQQGLTAQPTAQTTSTPLPVATPQTVAQSTA